MVKENTHLYIADLVFHRLRSERLSAAIYAHRTDYYLGAVIPDTYMYYSGSRRVSARLHGKNGEKTNEVVFRVLDSLKHERHNERDLALIYGYLAHCAADITFHPPIFYLSGHYYHHGPKARYRHFRLETMIDAMLNRHFFLDEMLRPGQVAGLRFPELLSRHLRLDAPEKTTRRALDTQIISSLLFRTKGIYLLAKALASVVKKRQDFPGLFYADVRKEKVPEPITYRHPVTGAERQVTLHTLVQESVVLSQKMIVTAHAYYEGTLNRRQAEKVLSGQSLETGLVGVGASRMRYFARP